MTTNAGTWFYDTPETTVYAITERLNNTFWGARYKHYYWTCTEAGPPCIAEGSSMDGTMIGLEWQPGEWLAVSIPEDVDADPIIAVLSKRILARTPSLTFGDDEGHQIYEWHIDGGQQRWQQIQGQARYIKPRRLNK